MKSLPSTNLDGYLKLVRAIYKDACAKCIADVSDLRDLTTIESRVEKEGVSFLTITLPRFCRDFESALQIGTVDPTTMFLGFQKIGSIPAFLQGMIGRLFNQETGRIYNEQSSDCSFDIPIIIDGVRQICLAFKKIELVCDPQRVRRALRNFIAVEQSNYLFALPKEDQEEFSLVSSVLWGNIIGDINTDGLLPRHGPGATAEHITGNQKYVWQRWHERLEPFFPILESAYPLGAYESVELETVTLVSEADEQPVRVVTVPKTMKGPRIIAIEPACMQYAQQAIRRILYDAIESSRETVGHINFRDQTVNQELALTSSRTGRYATIDLSDASDRVPRDLALEMFRSNPDLRDAIDACRSRSASLPDGTVVPNLSKFASMGSALCFPVESMYFYTICVAALLKEYHLPVSHANVFTVSRDVYVYGDDILVPTTNASAVIVYLQKYNCKVNTDKTFVSGKFRESCGVDAYDGELVTPVYIRTIGPDDRRQASQLISWVETANLFYKKGYWITADFMYALCEGVLGPLPYVSEVSSGLGRVTFRGYRSIERWNAELQHFENRCWSPRVVYRRDGIDGYAALMKSLGILESQEFGLPVSRDAQHLSRSALHHAVALTRGWQPA